MQEFQDEGLVRLVTTPWATLWRGLWAALCTLTPRLTASDSYTRLVAFCSNCLAQLFDLSWLLCFVHDDYNLYIDGKLMADAKRCCFSRSRPTHSCKRCQRVVEVPNGRSQEKNATKNRHETKKCQLSDDQHDQPETWSSWLLIFRIIWSYMSCGLDIVGKGKHQLLYHTVSFPGRFWRVATRGWLAGFFGFVPGGSTCPREAGVCWRTTACRWLSLWVFILHTFWDFKMLKMATGSLAHFGHVR